MVELEFKPRESGPQVYALKHDFVPHSLSNDQEKEQIWIISGFHNFLAM